MAFDSRTNIPMIGEELNVSWALIIENFSPLLLSIRTPSKILL